MASSRISFEHVEKILKFSSGQPKTCRQMADHTGATPQTMLNMMSWMCEKNLMIEVAPNTKDTRRPARQFMSCAEIKRW